MAAAAPAANGGAAVGMDGIHSNGAGGHGSANGGHGSGGGGGAALQLLQEFQRVQARRAELYARLSSGFRAFLEHGQEGPLARLMHELTPAFAAASQQVIAIERQLASPPVGRRDLAALLRRVQEGERSKLHLTLSWQALRAAHAAGRFSWQEAADRPQPRSAAAAAAGEQQQQQQQQLLQLLQQVQLSPGSSGSGSAAHAQHTADDTASASRADQQQAAWVSVKPGFYEQQMQQAVAAAAAATTQQQQQQQPAASSAAAGAGPAHAHAGGGCGCAGHGQQQGPALSDPLEPGLDEPNEAEYNAAVHEALQQLQVTIHGINEALEEVREAMCELQDEA